jgi:hypothetical protein
MLMHVFVYGNHTTVQYEDAGVAEPLGIVPEIHLHCADQNRFLSVLLSMPVCLHRYIYFSLW